MVGISIFPLKLKTILSPSWTSFRWGVAVVILMGLTDSGVSSVKVLPVQNVNPKSAKAIHQALTDPDLMVRSEAWDVVLSDRDPAWIPYLKTWALEDHRELKARAVTELARMTNVEAMKALMEIAQATTDMETKGVAIEGLSQFQDERVIPILAKAIREGEAHHPAMVWRALTALGGFGHVDACRAVAAFLRSENPDFRWYAAKLLASMKEGGGLSVLEEALISNPFPEVRQQAVLGLAVSGEARVTETLEKGLQDTDERVRIQAAGALRDGVGTALELPGTWKPRGKKEDYHEMIRRLLDSHPPHEFIKEIDRLETPRRLQAILVLSALEYSDPSRKAEVFKALRNLRMTHKGSRLPLSVGEAIRQTLEIIGRRYVNPTPSRRPPVVPR